MPYAPLYNKKKSAMLFTQVLIFYATNNVKGKYILEVILDVNVQLVLNMEWHMRNSIYPSNYALNALRVNRYGHYFLLFC